MSPSPVTGSCFCGEVQFEIELPTLGCAHCHCSMCRRPHGASYVTWVEVPPERFRVTSGEENIARYASSETGTRGFCKVCGSQMICENTSHPEFIDIALAALHGKIDRDPDAHYFFDSRADWTVVNDDLPKFGGETGDQPL